jgi:hypothetical protein
VQMDLPTGAAIVCTFGGVLVLMAIVHRLTFKYRTRAVESTQTKVA